MDRVQSICSACLKKRGYFRQDTRDLQILIQLLWGRPELSPHFKGGVKVHFSDVSDGRVSMGVG